MKRAVKLLKKFLVYYLISVGLTIYSSIQYMFHGKNLFGRAFIFALYMTLLAVAVLEPIVLGIICLIYLAIEAVLTIDMVIS